MAETILQFAHVTDTHLIMPGQQRDYSDIPPDLDEYARQILALPYTANEAAETLVRRINALPIQLDFVLHTGDVAGQLRAPEEYNYIRDTLSQIRYPIHYVPGNHDVGEAFQTVLRGQSGAYDHSFTLNGVQVVCLDSNGGLLPHSGLLADEQLAWLESICSAEDDRPLIVAMHHPPFTIDVPWLDELRIANGEAMHAILLKAKTRLRGVFCGHIHNGIEFYRDGVLYSAAPSAWCQFTGWPGHDRSTLDPETRPGFNVVTLRADSTTIRRHHYNID